VGSAGQFLHITGQIGLQDIEPPADIASVFPGQRPQLLARFIFNL
jgi:hypothetical protein